MKMTSAFGIGCFHFGLKKQSPFEFEALEYPRELNKTLECISNH